MAIDGTKLMNLADGKVLYNDLRDRQEDIVKVSDTQPQQESNKLWIDEGEEQTYSLATTADLQAQIEKLGGNFAKSYENLTLPTVAYKTFCMHDGELYLAKVVISSAEEWDASHWVKMDMATFNSAQFTEIFYQLESMQFKADKAGTVLDTTLSRGRKANTTVGEGSFAFGNNVEASNMVTHAEGLMTVASGLASHAEGVITNASGDVSHAEGNNTVASANNSHSEGAFTVASGTWSHAGGYGTTANSAYMTAIGSYNIPAELYPEWVAGTAYAVGDKVVHEGFGAECNTANSDSVWTDQHWNSIAATGETVFVIGNGTNENNRSNAMSVDIAGNEELAGGLTLGTTLSRGRKANTTVGDASLAFGIDTEASAETAMAFGYGSQATGWASFAEGDYCIASGDMAHAEGDSTVAAGTGAHAEGIANEANGDQSHAEGFRTIANGENEHVMGFFNIASEVYPNWVSGNEYQPGDMIIYTNGATYKCITANSDTTFNYSKWKHIYHSTDRAFSIGNGEGLSEHSNAVAINWDGTARFAGDVYVGCEADSTGGTKLAKETDVAPVIVTSASGAIASFADGAEMPVKDCVVNIEPVQDLHGYDDPYPAGGGKNKLPLMSEYTLSNNGVSCKVSRGVITLSGTSTAQARFELPLDSTVDLSPSTNKIAFCNSFASNSCTVYFVRDNTNVHYWGMASVNRVASGWTDSGNENVNKIIVVVEASTSVNGTISPMLVALTETDLNYSPYSNVCPITGWTGVNVTRAGKNLFTGNEKTINVTNGTLTFQNGKITRASTNAVAITNVVPSGNMTEMGMDLRLFPGTYIFKIYDLEGDVTSEQPYVEVINDDGTIVTQTYNTPFTLTQRAKLYSIKTNYTLLSANQTMSFKPVLERSSTSDSYEPYNGTTYPVSWQTEAGTVYGGNLDVTTGVLTVDRGFKTFDGTETWSMYQNATYGNTFRTDVSSKKIARSVSISNLFKNIVDCWGAGGVGKYGVFSDHTTVQALYFRPPNENVTTVEQFKEWLATNNVQVVYQLDTAQTYQLTPTEVTTLLGQNHLWADTGDIFVDYCADTKTYVDDAIPAVPVQDVQINGSSILQDGVANVPIASSTVAGVVKVNAANNAVKINSNGELGLVNASKTVVKNGQSYLSVITPEKQHDATFYGLAKAAGADMSSSSNAVGTYTDEAKIAIQKMLGIYEAPWELIREDTFTNATEADHIITVDANGQAFELTDIMLFFELPKQNVEASVSGAGAKHFYYGDAYVTTYTGGITQNANDTARNTFMWVEQKNGAVQMRATNMYAQGNRVALNIVNTQSNQIEPFQLAPTRLNFNKVVIIGVTGTGHYKLYGRRKWT